MQERRLAAIMFTDIVGYTALMGENEQKALKLLEKNRKLHQSLIDLYHGKMLKEMGDGILAVFNAASDAVHCAQEIQKISREDPELKLHIGIHLGEVTFIEDDVFGDGVNIASRIEGVAKEGEIYLSEDVYKSIKNKADIEVEFIGKKAFKNVKDPIGLYRLIEASIPEKRIDSTKSKSIGLIAAMAAILVILIYIISISIIKFKDNAPAITEKSIAVLPFKNIGNNREGDFFSDGIMETIISHLSKMKALKVISRTSVEQYRESNKTAPQIASDLGVVYLLEGSAQKYENKLRITVQLINARDDYHIWSENYDKDLTDIFLIQSEIAGKVADAMEVHITNDESERILNTPTWNLEAYDLYVQGRYYWNKRTENDLLLSLDYFKKAIELDPEFAQAWAGLADAYCMLCGYNYMPSSVGHPKAKDAANKALKLNRTLAEAHTSLGWIYAFYDHDWEESRHAFELALKYQPSYATAHSWYAWMLAVRGKFEMAEQHIQMARNLDPLSNIILASTGWIYYTSGSYERARELFKSAIERNPNFPRFYLWMGYNYMVNQQYDSALIHLEKAVILSQRHPQYLSSLGFCYGTSQQTEMAKDIFTEIIEKSDKRFVTNYDIGLTLLGTNQESLAMEYFKKAYHDRDIWIVFIAVDPRFTYLRSNPDFQNIVYKTGITPLWEK